MVGSGLENLLSVIYALNTVCSILMDKAVSRALRGLFLVETAFYTRLMLQALGLDMKILPDSNYNSEGSLPPGPWSLNYQIVQKGTLVKDKLLKNEELTKEDLSAVEQLHSNLSSYKDSLAVYLTDVLWIQCLQIYLLSESL